MKRVLKAVAIIIIVWLVIAMVRAGVEAFVTDTANEAKVTKQISTKEGYLEKVRQNNPEYPELMACIYGKYIDKHGLEETLKMDMEYYNADSLPEPLQTEIAEMGANC